MQKSWVGEVLHLSSTALMLGKRGVGDDHLFHVIGGYLGIVKQAIPFSVTQLTTELHLGLVMVGNIKFQKVLEAANRQNGSGFHQSSAAEVSDAG